MTTYQESGVDVAAGDKASRLAYTHASATFNSRKGMIGEPVYEQDGYAGFLDMGDYYLVMSDDSTGTKIDVAAHMNKYETLGYDLLAMVADDIVCVGAEVISVSNCLDVPKVETAMVDSLMRGLSEACSEQKIVVPAGEIAEVPGAVNRGVWSATAVGVVNKDKVIKPETIKPGDSIISLKAGAFRSNGFSLIRNILTKAFGDNWYNKEWKSGQSWGEAVLTPSIVYQAAVLNLIGRFKHERKVNVKGIAHITGGGIPSKLARVLKKSGLGAELTEPWQPHEAVKDIIELGSVPVEEAYRTWNMGNAMMLVVDQSEESKALELLQKESVEAKVIGKVTEKPGIKLKTYQGSSLDF